MIDFDFMPAEFHLARADRRGVQRNSALIIVMVLCMGAWMSVHAESMRRAEEQYREVCRQHRQVMAQQLNVTQLFEKREALNARTNLLRWLDHAPSAVVVLSAISRAAPNGVILTDLTLGPTVAPLQPVRLPDSASPRSPEKSGNATESAADMFETLRLVGLASTGSQVGDFAAGITAQPYFCDVATELRGEDKQANHRGVRFEITCRVFPQSRMSP